MDKVLMGKRPSSALEKAMESDSLSPLPIREQTQTAPKPAPHDISGEAHAVLINVYHATPNSIVNMYNSLAVPLGLAGAFHIGVQVWGDEWSFGQSGEGSGVSFHKPRSLTHHTYHKTYAVGETKLNRKDAINVIRELGVEWPGYGYHVLKRNCCHFASVLVEALGCDPLPKWMVGLSDDLRPLASFFVDFKGILPGPSCADGKRFHGSISDGKEVPAAC